MAQENWAHLRLSVAFIPRRGAGHQGTVDWRLSAKAPGGDWTERDTVAFGSDSVHGVPWPPSRDDMLAMMTEVLMGIRWTPGEGDPPF